MTFVDAIIDDLSQPWPMASNGASWALIADQVMGGRSTGAMRREMIEGRQAITMQGEVSLENNGGFLQIALDLKPDASAMDASGWAGIEIDVYGNGESYNLHLRTADLTRPWQSYRQSFATSSRWHTAPLAFADFEAHRTNTPFNPGALRRIGIIAIGRSFRADISIGGLRFYA
ncbi:CIA30 family protein [Hyphomonadaceae bacterium BL14]|nr:CIA30 family protein [Hyphomonadaceae bacterium BL14]